MPNLSQYKKQLGLHTDGEARKIQSDQVMEWSWDEDILTQTMYFYDYYHDSHPTQLNNLHPERDKGKIPCRAKFVPHSSKTYAKDQITYHLMFKPSEKMFVDYYQEYIDIYESSFPIGLYCDVMDSDGNYNKWLVVDAANVNDPQFPSFELLRCDYVLQYMMNGKKQEVSVVLQSQNSYNSGIWTDFRITSPEDQQKFAVPLNRDTEKIYYNLRMIVDGNVLTEPRTWKVTKVNRVAPNGIARITLAQDQFDQHKDYIEVNDRGVVIGKWANYYDEVQQKLQDTTIPQPTIRGEFTYSGKPQIKVGGSYKKLTLTFYKNQDILDIKPEHYFFTIDNEDIGSLVSIIEEDNTIKVKFNGKDEWLGKVMNITNTTEIDGYKVITSVDVEIVGL